jgi:hypothetical protein
MKSRVTHQPVSGSRCFLFTWLWVLAGLSVRALAAEDDINWAKEREFWAFRSPVTQARPAVKNKRWASQPLDYFILARLEQKNLSPSPEAEKRTLIRRVTFDLTGLPPTVEEVEAFLKDRRTGAYERLVERLLASPRFGERMASMWLPLARYAEDQAHQVGSDTKFFYPNAWKYRDWVIGAFNRDLPYGQFIRLQLAADKLSEKESSKDDLAALGLIGLGPKYYNRNRLDVMADEWEDRVDTVTRSLLGLTVACARCHDHKFEPITREDYYALAGVFASTKMVNKVPGGVAPKEDNSEKPPKEKMDPATLHMVEEGSPTNLNVFIRGNVERKGPLAERRFLQILSEGEPAAFKDGSGRKELAEKIASRNNPLTARVIVNRVWGEFFGHPLVATPSNFGHSGTKPTHPELLDDLAVRFMDHGWSIKSLVRETVLSSTYRQDSQNDPARMAADASNELLSRMNRRRLTVEQWRDATLFVSGELFWETGQTIDVGEPTNHLRTVYAHVSRLKLNDLLALFDYPDANVHAEKRSVTTTAMQKLFVLNSPFMLARAKALAERLTANPRESDKSRVQRAYRILFARTPEKEELNVALKFLAKPATVEMSQWEQYAQILLASNEMLYVD